MRFDGFIGPAYSLASVRASAQRCVNLFAEVIEAGNEPQRVVYHGTPGLRLFTTLPASPVRGIWVNESRCFAVGGSRLYEVFSSGLTSDLGDVGNDGNPVLIFPNGTQLIIISAGFVYIHTGTEIVDPTLGTLEGVVNRTGTIVTWLTGDKFDTTMAGQTITIAGIDYTVASVSYDMEHLVLTDGSGMDVAVVYSATPQLTARSGAFLDGYFIVSRPDSKQINISQLYDGKTWDPADFAIKEGYPDNIIALLADHEELWIFGTETTEIWRNTGNADFPFEQDMAAFIHLGCISPWVPCRLLSGVAWLGGDSRGRIVAYRAQGFQPVRVSTHAVEHAWSQYATVSDAVSYVYRMEGHEFWRIVFPSANASWQFDANTGFWSEIASGTDRTALDKHRAWCHGFVFGKNLVGDWETGAIYELDLDAFDDAGTPIWRGRRSPHLTNDSRRAFHPGFRLDLQPDVDTPGAEFLLEWSDNGGRTYNGPLSGTAAIVNSDDEDAYVPWRRLGEARDRIYGVWSNAAIRHCWLGAHLEPDPIPGLH